MASIVGGSYSRKGSMQFLLTLLVLATFVFTICIHPFVLHLIGVSIYNNFVHSLAMISLFMQKIVNVSFFIVSYTYLCEVYPTVVIFFEN